MRRLVIEPPMTEAEALRLATEEEIAAARDFRPERRREFLAWRTLVRREVGGECRFGYRENGAPYLVGRDDLFIGVAHCRGRIAVAISDAPCAVDIEPLSRDFGPAISRFMTDREQRLSEDPSWPAAAWCAKETLYKYAGLPGLDLRRDLRLEGFDPSAGTISGRIRASAPLRLSFGCRDGFVAVWMLE